jgi:hypothetical protein
VLAAAPQRDRQRGSATTGTDNGDFAHSFGERELLRKVN